MPVPLIKYSAMGMEPEVQHFLRRISFTLSMGLLWLLIHMTAGIYFNLAFFEESPSWKNYLYYAGFLITLILLLLYFRKLWKGKM